MEDPTVVFRFSTTPMIAGTTIRIYNTSSNWDYYIPANSTTATLTIVALDGNTTLFNGAASYTTTYTPTSLVGDFYIDLAATTVFGTGTSTIPDDILTVTIVISGATSYTYSTDEVFYYNSWKTKTDAAFAAVDFVEDINSREIKYACMVNALYQGLTADIFVGNTSGIYEKFDIFTRLAEA
jgi:hypothetical protein